jgi:hypothetical protein
MARIELSQKELSHIREGIKMTVDSIEVNDLWIVIDYEKKDVTVRNKHTWQELETNCRDRRLVFKMFK